MEPVKTRSQEDLNILKNSLINVKFFQKLQEEKGDEVLFNCLNNLKLEEFKLSDIIFRVGTYGSVGACYEEQVKKPINKKNKKSAKYLQLEEDEEQEYEIEIIYHEMNQLKAGIGFGELGLINNIARSATIIAKEQCYLATLDKKSYDSVFEEEKKSFNEKLEYLENNVYFSSLPKKNLANLINTMKVRKFKKGEILYKEKDLANSLFIIKKGTVKIMKTYEIPRTKTEREVDLNTFYNTQKLYKYIEISIAGDNDVLGLEDILNDYKRCFTVQIDSAEAEIIMLNKKDFQRRLGPLEGVFWTHSIDIVKKRCKWLNEKYNESINNLVPLNKFIYGQKKYKIEENFTSLVAQKDDQTSDSSSSDKNQEPQKSRNKLINIDDTIETPFFLGENIPLLQKRIGSLINKKKQIRNLNNLDFQNPVQEQDKTQNNLSGKKFKQIIIENFELMNETSNQVNKSETSKNKNQFSKLIQEVISQERSNKFKQLPNKIQKSLDFTTSQHKNVLQRPSSPKLIRESFNRERISRGGRKLQTNESKMNQGYRSVYPHTDINQRIKVEDKDVNEVSKFNNKRPFLNLSVNNINHSRNRTESPIIQSQVIGTFKNRNLKLSSNFNQPTIRDKQEIHDIIKVKQELVKKYYSQHNKNIVIDTSFLLENPKKHRKIKLITQIQKSEERPAKSNYITSQGFSPQRIFRQILGLKSKM